MNCSLTDILRKNFVKSRQWLKKRYPDYQLATEHISHYRDMTLVTFAVGRNMLALVVSFPMFVKDYRKPPLAVFEIEMFPVPIPDSNPRANSYTKVKYTQTIHCCSG